MPLLISASIQRPADTNAYIALDTIANATSGASILTFDPAAARIIGDGGYITKARLTTDQKTNTARYRLHLFHTAPTMINDNSPFTLLYANRDKRIGYIDFAACATEDSSGSNCAHSLNSTVRLAFKCANDARVIYGILETLDPFTPASQQNFHIELSVEQG